MKILISEFAKKRPWLDLDNGELVSVLKKNNNNIFVKWIYQIETFSTILQIADEFDLVILHIEHQSINRAMLSFNEMKRIEKKLIIYGYGVAFHSQLNCFENCILNDDIHEVISKINSLFNMQLIYEEDELEVADYSCLPIKSIDNYPIRYSKGCENNCPYCERSLEKVKIYKRGESFEKELFYAKRNYGVKTITFMDSSLFGGINNNFFDEINPLLKKYDIPWRANGVTLASLNEEVIKKAAESGCYLLSIGIEHFDCTIKTGKKIDFEKLERILGCLRDNSIFSLGFFISGLQNDTFEKTMYSFEKICKSSFDIKLLTTAVALPGTDLWNYVSQNGRFLCEIGEAFPDKKTTIHFDTPSFTREERILVLEYIKELKGNNDYSKKLIKERLQGRWSTSEDGNIIWKTI